MDSDEQIYFENYVEIMKNCMKSDINPFENFDEFALGGEGNGHNDTPVSLDTLFDFIFTNEEMQYPSLLKARKFWRSMHDNIREYLLDDGLRQYTSGWPAFEENWSAANFDGIRTLAMIARMGINSLFEIKTYYKNAETEIIVWFQLPFHKHFDIQDSYSENIQELISGLELNQEKINNIIDNMNYVITAVKDIFPLPYTNPPTKTQYTAQEMKKLQEYNYEVFFETYLGRPINDNDIFYFNFSDYINIERYLRFISELKPEILADFIMVQTVLCYKINKSNITLEYFCPAIIAATLSEYLNTNDIRKQIEIFTRFMNLMGKIKNEVEVSTDEYVADSLDKTKSLIDYALEHFSQEKVNKQYENLEISNNFYQNLINIRRYGVVDSLKAHHSCDITDFLLNSIKTHNKPMLQYYHTYMHKLINEMMPYQFIESDYSDDIKRIINEYKIKNNLTSWTEETLWDIEDECSGIVLAVHYCFNDYKAWLEENEIIANKQNEILEKINLNNYKAYFISFYQNHRFYLNEIVIAFLYEKHFKLFI